MPRRAVNEFGSQRVFPLATAQRHLDANATIRGQRAARVVARAKDGVLLAECLCEGKAEQRGEFAASG